MLEIIFNSEKLSITEPTKLSDLLVQQGYVDGGFAVAVNQEFVPRGNHMEHIVVAGDKVDVMTPMQGG